MRRPRPVSDDEIQRAQSIADRFTVCDIESHCRAERLPGSSVQWLDTHAYVSAREHAPPALDVNRELLDYAVHRGLVARHPHRAHLVRITRREDLA